MIGFLVAKLAGWLVKRSLAGGGAMTPDHAARCAKVGLLVVAVVFAIGGFLLWDWLDDRAAIRQHEAARLEQSLAAERSANAGAIMREQAAVAASAETTQQLEEIHAQDPESAVRPASRADRAVADRLRQR
jgi:hypothetical protein